MVYDNLVCTLTSKVSIFFTLAGLIIEMPFSINFNIIFQWAENG